MRAAYTIRTVRPLLVILLLSATASHAGPLAAQAKAPIPPLAAAGRWFVDALGRVVMFHGMNQVEKRPPYYPAAFGFGDDDAAFLADEGFNTLRLGVDLRGLMPAPGQVDETYIDHLAESVAALGRHGLFVLLDFHQDGYAPLFNGNGFPDWMAITDGLPNPPDAVFPLYYIQNPAMQRAFEHFWANSPGPGGIGLQDYFVQGLERIVTRFASDPMVLGYELMNEPWPGATWVPCVTGPAGCPDLEQERLAPFYRKGAAAVRRIAPAQLVFVEPFVLFNFGQAPTTIPGTDPGLALSFHSYALSVAGEEAVLRFAVEAAERAQQPLVETEFGASTDAVLLSRLTRQLDDRLVPWMFWHYGQRITRDPMQPPGPDNLTSAAALAALVRPYPMATTGVPARIAFDPETRVFEFSYTTERPGGGRYHRRLPTLVSVPHRQYPDGYTVEVSGARVTSKPCAPQLTLRTRRLAQSVAVRITPGLRGAAARRGCS